MKREQASARGPALGRWKARACAPPFWLVLLLFPFLFAWQLALDLARRLRGTLPPR